MPLIAANLPVAQDIDAPDALFKGATFDQIGVDPGLTAQLQKQFDPDGSKYGGDINALKNGILNEMTARKSGIVSSVMDWARSKGETVTERQNSNLAERIYDSAPNRLFSPNATASERAQAFWAGVKGGLWGEGALPTELALNLLMTPVALAKAGIPLLSGAAKGATASGIVGSISKTTAVRDAVERLAAGEVLDEASQAAVRSTSWRAAAKRGAAFEAGTNAVLGGFGGAVEHAAAENRGIDKGSMTDSVLGGALGGAIIGGAFGGISGAIEGRGLGRELLGNEPGRILSEAGAQPLSWQAVAQRDAADAERLAAAEAEAAASAQPAAPDTSMRDAVVRSAADINRAGTSPREVISDLAASFAEVADEAGNVAGYSPRTLRMASETLARHSDPVAVAADLRRQADVLEAQADAQSVQQAGLLRARATTIEDFAGYASAKGESLGEALARDGIPTPETIGYLRALNPELADAMDAERAAKAGAKTAAVPVAPAATPAQPQGASAAPQGPGASRATAAPSPAPAAASAAQPAPAQAAAPAPAPAAADAPEAPVVEPQAANAAAAELDQLKPRMTGDDATAFADAEALVAQAGMDMPTVIGRVQAEGGVAAVAADVAKATGQEPAAVQQRLGRATGAITKARMARDAEGQAAPKPAAERAAAPAPAPATAAAEQPAAAKIEESEAAEPEAPEGLRADQAGADENYATIVGRAQGAAMQAKTRLADLATELAERSGSDGFDFAAAADEMLDKLRAEDEFMAVALRGIDGAALAQPGGFTKLSAQVDRAASESISWSYASAIVPLMRDPFAVTDFEKLLAVMPGVPESARRRINEDFARYTREALGARIAEMGEAEARRIYGSGAVDGVPRVPDAIERVDVGAIIKDATAGLDAKQAQRVGRAVRDFHRELADLAKGSGLYFDEALLGSALRYRAAKAIEESTDEAVRAANPELFRRLDALKAARADGGTVISVRRAADAYSIGSMAVERGSLFPNPVVNRILVDEHGGRIPASFATEAELVSGRSLGLKKSQLGGVQGILANTAGLGYYGPLFASINSNRGAKAAIREAGRAAVAASGNRRFTMEIDGKKVSGVEREVKGLYHEGLADRMIRRRMEAIIAAVRKRLAGGDEEAFQAELADIGKLLRKVTDSEVAFATDFIESADRLKAAQEAARARAANILEDMRAAGKTVEDVQADLVKRLRAVMKRHEDEALAGVEGLARDSGKGDAKAQGAGRKEARAKERRDAVVFKSLDPKDSNTYEFVPAQHMEFAEGGQLKLLGKVIGTYEKGDGGALTLKINGEANPIKAANVVAAGKKVRGTKAGRAVLDENKAKLVPTEPGAQLEDGAVVPEGVTRTEEADRAKDELAKAVGGTAGTPDPTSPLAAPTKEAMAQVPAGRRLVLKRLDVGADAPIGQRFILVRDFHATLLDAIPQEARGGQWVAGTVEQWLNKTGGVSHRLNAGLKDKFVASFRPMGKEAAAINPGVELALRAAQADAGMAPALAAAQKRPISLREAEQIKLSSGMTAAEGLAAVRAAAGSALPKTAAEFDAWLSGIKAISDELTALVPNGIALPQASRRTSFTGLMRALEGSPRQSIEEALHMLRRLDSGNRALPYFAFDSSLAGEVSDMGGGWFNAALPAKGSTGNYIAIKGGALPAKYVVTHEVGHWAFANLLTPAEQVTYFASLRKGYGADGLLDAKLLAGDQLVPGMGGHAGSLVSGELFSWGLTRHVMEMERGRAAPNALMTKLMKMVKGVLEHFFGKKEAVEPEVRALFERVFPSTPAATRNRYDTLVRVADGKAVSAVAPEEGVKGHEVAVMLADFAKRTDEMRGRLDAHLLSLDDPLAAPMAEDLKAASIWAWKLLHGRTDDGSVSEGLRGALRVSRKRLGDWLRDASGKVVKSDTKTRKTSGQAAGMREVIYEPAPGAVNHWRLFGRDGGGLVMAEAGEHTRISKALDQAASGDYSGVVNLASDGQSAAFYSRAEARALELEKSGMPWEKAAEQAEAETLRAMGIDRIEDIDNGSLMSAALDAAGSGERASQAMRAVALQVRDLLTDALEHFESKVEENGYLLQRNGLAELELPKPALSGADAQAAAAVRAAPKVEVVVVSAPAPASDAAVAAAARKVAQSGGQAPAPGIPAGAPAGIANLMSRVTHRDKEQKVVIDGLGYDLLNHVGIKEPTNADIARLTGADLEEGLLPDAPAAKSAAFDEFRAAMRRISENLTGEKGDPTAAVRELAEMMARWSNPEMPEREVARLGNGAAAMTARTRNVPDAQKSALRAMEEDADFRDEVASLVQDILPIIEANLAPRAASGTVAVPAHPMAPETLRMDGAMHPGSARAVVADRIEALEPAQQEAMLRFLGLDDAGDDAAETLARAVVFYQPGSATKLGAKKLGSAGLSVTTAPSSGAAALKKAAQKEGNDVLARLAGELEALDLRMAGAAPQERADILAARQRVVEAIRKMDSELAADFTDAVRPFFISPTKVIDFEQPDALAVVNLLALFTERRAQGKIGFKAGGKAVADRIDQLLSGGDLDVEAFSAILGDLAASIKKSDLEGMLADAGLAAYKVGDRLNVIDKAALRDLDELIGEAMGARSMESLDAPLGGEALLRLSLPTADEFLAKADSLGWSQRAAQLGADAETAEVVGRMAPGKGVPRDQEAVHRVARKFSWPVQLRSNSSRMAKAGMTWAAGLVDGFREAVDSAMGKALVPVLRTLDDVSGRSTAMARYTDDLVRNVSAVRGKVPQSDAEQRIALALRTGKVEALPSDLRTAAMVIKRHMETMLERQRAAGVPVGDITAADGVSNYLPQRFNLDWITSNYEEAVSRLARWFEREGAKEGASDRARRVIDRVMLGDDEAQFLGAGSVHQSAFEGKLFSRVLTIGDKEMSELKLYDLFDNNLRDLVVGYTHSAESKIETAKRFGVKGHGFTTYMDIGMRGRQAAIDALMSGVSSMERVVGTMVSGADQLTVSSVQPALAQPLTRDPAEAAALVDTVLNGLLGTESLEAKKRALVNALVARHPDGATGSAAPHIRARMEAVVNGLSDFGPNGDTLASSEAKFAEGFVRLLTGGAAQVTEDQRRMQPVVRGLMAFNAVSLLGMATISSLSDPALALVRSGNLKAWFKGIAAIGKSLTGSPEEMRAAETIGVTINQQLHQVLMEMGNGRAGRLTNAFFLANGLTPWTATMRKMAAVVGFESIKSAQLIAQRERAAGNLESREYLRAMRYLRQLGVAGLAGEPALTTLEASLDNETVRRGVLRFANESIFEPGRDDIPVQFQTNPFWKLMWQFKSYPMMLGRAMKRTVGEAFAHETTASGERVWVGDVKPLVALLTVGVGLAGVSQAARDVVGGRNDEAAQENGDEGWRMIRDRRWSRIAQELGLMEKDEGMSNETVDKALGWYIESMLGLGTLGLVGDMLYQSAKAIDNGAFGRERIMSQIAGPTFGTFSSALQAVEGGIAALKEDESNAKERSAVRQVVSRIPLVSSQRPWVEGLTDWVAGEAQK